MSFFLTILSLQNAEAPDGFSVYCSVFMSHLNDVTRDFVIKYQLEHQDGHRDWRLVNIWKVMPSTSKSQSEAGREIACLFLRRAEQNKSRE